MKTIACVNMQNYMRDILIIFLGMLIAEYFCVAPIVRSETISAGGHSVIPVYVSDMENKQASVTLIKEDIEFLERGLDDKGKAAKYITDGSDLNSKINSELTAKDIMQLTPPAAKLSVTSCHMAGTLRPETNLKVVKDDPDRVE